MIARLFAGGLLLTTAACVSYADDYHPAPGADGAACNADAASGLIGQAATSALGTEALQRTGARSLRWIPLGAAVTMDYRPDRLNVKLDARNRVTGFSCG